MPDFPIKESLERLNELMVATESRYRSLLEKVHPVQYDSAVNLLHYLAIRSQDIRSLQNALHAEGLSTLGSSESHMRSQLLSVLKHLGHQPEYSAITYEYAQQLLRTRSEMLFGTCSKESIPCIMVSFKTSYADDILMVKKLLKAGMNIARINTAHDDVKTWQKMVSHVREASRFTGIPCKIYMDLAGPKIRTSINKQKKGRIKIDEEDTFYLADEEGRYNKLPVVGTTLPGLATQLRKDDRVLFDDGLIEARVIDQLENKALLEVVRISSKKPFLRTEKGINFPDSHFSLSALTGYDLECLPFILENADMIGYSFLQSTADLEALQNAMKEKKLPVILKIERPEAVQHLPELLLQAMQEECYGVMIARGDLAVEIGFERLSEIQEEILWICEAAHAPVIWATQVLESLNKIGLPSRSEMTDAAHGIMAECILLNKGAHTLKVIQSLKDILARSGGHHLKKRYTFRPLNIAKNFLNNMQVSAWIIPLLFY